MHEQHHGIREYQSVGVDIEVFVARGCGKTLGSLDRLADPQLPPYERGVVVIDRSREEDLDDRRPDRFDGLETIDIRPRPVANILGTISVDTFAQIRPRIVGDEQHRAFGAIGIPPRPEHNDVLRGKVEPGGDLGGLGSRTRGRQGLDLDDSPRLLVGNRNAAIGVRCLVERRSELGEQLLGMGVIIVAPRISVLRSAGIAILRRVPKCIDQDMRYVPDREIITFGHSPPISS